MKVGDYVRTNDRGIRKVGEIIDNLLYRDEEGNLHQKGNLIKSSPNIIDLIQYGDYVNGWKVIEHAHIPNKLFVPYVYIGGKGFTTYEDYSWELKKENEDKIHTILTSEQFEEIEYVLDKGE